MRYTETRGSPEIRDLQYGEQFKEEIAQCIKLWNSEGLAGGNKRVELKLVCHYLERAFPDLWAEIGGVGEGAG